jgi:hypothetical protein
VNARTTLFAVGEILAWWAALVVLWLMLISAVHTLEWVVGACAAGVGAPAARAGRRAVVRR